MQADDLEQVRREIDRRIADTYFAGVRAGIRAVRDAGDTLLTEDFILGGHNQAIVQACDEARREADRQAREATR